MRTPTRFDRPDPVQSIQIIPEVSSSLSCGASGSHETVTIGVRVDAREHAAVMRELAAWLASRPSAKSEG